MRNLAHFALSQTFLSRNNIECILLFIDTFEKFLQSAEQKASKERLLERTALLKYVRRLHLFSRVK
jgi:hypothetical protein